MSDVKDAAPMTAADVRRARELLGMSPDHFAAELGLIPDIVRAFEAGTVRVPSRIARDLRWRVAVEEHERALEAAGHGPCPAVADLKERVARPGADFNALSKEYEAHAASCEQCRAREMFARTLPPLPPPPTPAGARAVMILSAGLARLPAWARPVAWAAALLAVLLVFRLIAILAAALRQ